eukprot:1159496-Pelagomonas_calceolata.AAC.4
MQACPSAHSQLMRYSCLTPALPSLVHADPILGITGRWISCSGTSASQDNGSCAHKEVLAKHWEPELDQSKRWFILSSL